MDEPRVPCDVLFTDQEADALIDYCRRQRTSVKGLVRQIVRNWLAECHLLPEEEPHGG